MLAPPTDDPLSAMTKQTLLVESRRTHVVTLLARVATTSVCMLGGVNEDSDDPLPYRATNYALSYKGRNFIHHWHYIGNSRTSRIN